MRGFAPPRCCAAQALTHHGGRSRPPKPAVPVSPPHALRACLVPLPISGSSQDDCYLGDAALVRIHFKTNAWNGYWPRYLLFAHGSATRQ